MSNNCEYCYEKRIDCVCTWTKCDKCGKKIPESHASEYRGKIWCEEHDFDEQIKDRDDEREHVIEITNAAILSQRKGEFINNRSKYNLNNVAKDGLPVVRINEPEILKAYEKKPVT